MKSEMIWAKCFLASFLFLSFYFSSQAQNTTAKKLTDDVADKLELYAVKTRSPVLFIHFDKNIYTNNENVWFTGYFLNLTDIDVYKVLSVSLVRDDDHLVVTNEKFIVSNGLAFGNTVIPDSTAAGHYSFVAYSNRLVYGEPDVLFTQRITIKRDAQTGFNASLNPLDTALKNVNQKVMLLVTPVDMKKPASNITASYYLGNSLHPVQKGDVKITPAGQYTFDIPSSVIKQGDNRLHVRISQAGETKDLNIDLPAQPQNAVVHFFPEGGNLVAGLPNIVGWEVKSHIGMGLATDAILYENKKIIDTIHTNSYGFGRFALKPKEKAVYTVKLFGVNKKDTLYQMPLSVSHVPAMSVNTAVVNSILTVGLNTDKPQTVYLNIHNYDQLFISTPVNLIGEKKTDILLNDIPKGVMQITLTDSIGRPLAERLFFAHYDKRPGLQISTDKTSYKSREKVTVSLKLNSTGPLDEGLVSVACVQENRLQINNKNDIESYFYLKAPFGELPVKENYLGTEEADKRFLEDILLIKGWRRYKWLDMLNVKPQDTVAKQSDLVLKGLVTKNGNHIKMPVKVINFKDPLNTISTDSIGNLLFSDKALISQRNKKSFFYINNDKYGLYQVELIDPYSTMTKKILNEIELPDRNLPQQPVSQLLEMTGLNRAIKLNEVKIKGYNNNKLMFQAATGANACGDYICRNGYFNCINHRNEPDNTPPIVGKSYYINGILTPYWGCDVEAGRKGSALEGIYMAQEFYPSDLSQPNSPPEYMSTIYWKYLAKVTSMDLANFSFYTNDITGRFKIVVQGRTAKDMIYGEKTFEVLKNKY